MTATTVTSASWTTVAARELHELWASGMGLLLLAAATAVYSVVVLTYSLSPELSVIAAADGTLLVVRVGLGTGMLLGLVVGATTFSAMREQGTLETVLLTPLPRRHLVLGETVSAASLAVLSVIAVVPYLMANRRPGAAVAEALTAIAIVALPMLVLAVLGGMVVSLRCNSSRASLGITLAVLAAAAVPVLVPSPVADQPAVAAIAAVDPLAAASRFLDEVIVGGATPSDALGWLLSPVAGAAAVTAWWWRESADIELEVRR